MWRMEHSPCALPNAHGLGACMLARTTADQCVDQRCVLSGEVVEGGASSVSQQRGDLQQRYSRLRVVLLAGFGRNCEILATVLSV